MKRILSLAVVFLWIISAPLSLAENDYSMPDIDDCYDEVEKDFIAAVTDSQAPPAAAGELFQALIEKCDAMPPVLDRGDCYYYYNYAKGYLAFMDEDWGQAKRYFEECDPSHARAEEAIYYCYAMGMLYMGNGSYVEAINYFQNAINGGRLITPSRVRSKVGECRNLYEDSLREEGNDAFGAGNYEKALEYYAALMKEFPESDGKQLYEMCLARMQEGTPFNNLNVTDITDTTANVDWSAVAPPCEIILSMDLASFPGTASQAISQSSTNFAFDVSKEVNAWKVGEDGALHGEVALSGLLPGTAYAIGLKNADTGELLGGGVFETMAPQAHTRYHAESARVYCYSKTALKGYSSVIKDGGPAWPLLQPGTDLEPCSENAIAAGTNDNKGYVVILKLSDNGTSIAWEKYSRMEYKTLCVLLHIEDTDTVCYMESADRSPSILEEYGHMKDSDKLFAVMLLDKLFSKIEADAGTLQGKKYRLSMLMDNMSVMEISGSIG